MWEDLGEYIINQCISDDNINNSSFKIVEISIGKFFAVYNYLNNFIDINNLNSNNSNNNIDNYEFNKNINGNDNVNIDINKYNNYDLNSINIDFTAIDIAPANSNIIFDDITNPDMDIYRNADIIYSIRPPQELQPYIADIVTKTGAILIIKPLFNEDLNLNLDMKLVNYKKAVFYQSK